MLSVVVLIVCWSIFAFRNYPLLTYYDYLFVAFHYYCFYYIHMASHAVSHTFQRVDFLPQQRNHFYSSIMLKKVDLTLLPDWLLKKP